jgi:two-component system, OmpR family, response regulator CpxR
MVELRDGVDVLVVDDEPGVRSYLCTLFEFHGYRVAAAENGAEALRHLRLHHPPGLILLDLMMPVMDGWELSRVLQSEIPLSLIPRVVITAVRADRPSEARLGALAYVHKPFDAQQLLRFARKYCAAP